MKDIDFSACPFIDEVLCFLTYFDFCKNAKVLKAYYDALEQDAKRFYKFYVYANIHMTEHYKNLIWEFLNNEDLEYYVNLITALNKYKAM